MIHCTDFIPAYSELFKFLEQQGGARAVEDFWRHLSDRYLGDLRSAVAEHGLRGCWLYWNHTLNEEAADFTMELDEEAGLFRITMHHCPSMGRLLESDRVEPYHDYCRHCDVLYRRVLEPLGFDYDLDVSRSGEAKCVLTVRPSGAA
jgi:hypothetical protein